VFAVSYGVGELYTFFEVKIKRNIMLVSASIISLLILVPFFYSYAGAVAGRKNRLSDATMNALVLQYAPSVVIADDAFMDLYFLEPTKQWKAYQPGERIYSVFQNPNARNKGTYMFVSQHAISNESCDKMLQSIAPKLKCAMGKTAYEYYFATGAPLDIAREANSIYNTLSIKIIKI